MKSEYFLKLRLWQNFKDPDSGRLVHSGSWPGTHALILKQSCAGSSTLCFAVKRSVVVTFLWWAFFYFPPDQLMIWRTDGSAKLTRVSLPNSSPHYWTRTWQEIYIQTQYMIFLLVKTLVVKMLDTDTKAMLSESGSRDPIESGFDQDPQRCL